MLSIAPNTILSPRFISPFQANERSYVWSAPMAENHVSTRYFAKCGTVTPLPRLPAYASSAVTPTYDGKSISDFSISTKAARSSVISFRSKADHDKSVYSNFARSQVISPRSLSRSGASSRLYHSFGTQIGGSISGLSTCTDGSVEERLERKTIDIYANICTVFWKMALTFHPFIRDNVEDSSISLVEFSSLWPSGKHLCEILPETCAALPGSIEILCQSAIFANILPLLRALVDLNIIGVNQTFDDGFGLLHLACIAQNVEAVQFLATAGIDYNIKDTRGRLPLQLCFTPNVTSTVISCFHVSAESPSKERKRRDATLHEKQTIFGLAQNPSSSAKLLVKLQEIHFNVNKEQDNTGDLLIHTTLKQGLCQLPLIFSLVRLFDADINLPNVDGMTCLMLQASIGDIILLDTLICVFGAELDVKNRVHNGWTALHYACANKHVDIVNTLLKRGVDFNVEDSDGIRADELALTCSSNDCRDVIVSKRLERTSKIRQLIKKDKLTSDRLIRRTDLYVTDKFGFTPLMLAAHVGGIETTKFLLTLPNIAINAQHELTLRTALTMASISGNVNIVRMLLEKNANPSIHDKDGLLAVHYAVQNNDLTTVEILLRSPTALTQLKMALDFAESSEMVVLLQSALIRRQRDLVNPALFEMSRSGDADGIYSILENGDSVNPLDDAMDWSLYIAVRGGHLNVTRLLLRWNGDIISRHRITGNTVLHVACDAGYLDIAAFLAAEYDHRHDEILNQYDDMPGNLLNAAGMTPLMLAANNGHVDVVRFLLTRGASTCVLQLSGELYSPPATDRCRCPPGSRCNCAQFGDIQRAFQDHTANHADRVFKAIAEKKGLKILKSIFLPKHDHNLRDAESGDSPLMRACLLGRTDMVNYLLQSAKYILDNFFLTRETCVVDPRGYVSSSSEVGEFLPSTDNHRASEAVRNRMAPPKDIMTYEDTVAALVESMHSVSLTNPVLAGYEVNQLYATSSFDGATAYHRAVEYSDSVSCLSCLLSVDQSAINVQNAAGLSPLHVACRLNRKTIVKKLVSLSFVDLNCRSLDGSLPEDMTSNKAVIKLVQQARGQQVPRAPSLACPMPSRRTSVYGAPSEDIRSNVAASDLDFDRINQRFTMLKEQNNVFAFGSHLAYLH